MTAPTPGISGTTGANAAAAAGAAAPAKKLAEASKDFGDKDTFLKLLVAQLKYQDPSKPADSTQFLAQTAQFTQVEKLGDIADMLKSQRMVSAASLVGQNVTYMDEMGARQTGTISAAKLNGDSEPMLRIGNSDVLLSKVMEIQAAGSGAPVAANPAAAQVAANPAAAQVAANQAAAAAAANPAAAPGAAKPPAANSGGAGPTSSGSATGA
ncbi:flagellar hook capping protein [Actinoplanes sp. TBRC 11911]|uniref:flagellar hook assembly protein FlgD n=1 Tax=Actinoplanes sp. TBRC 11911 TaxID=2729386 RepID=UPI00145DC10E|nr:flagellar hook capping FlgD N-terminal domain-containing protein [Actinoplanes sp. TBRC 11911]NMO50173.1 flagellar hook capping protein [Actinoplanes sp. TBRC 11911]